MLIWPGDCFTLNTTVGSHKLVQHLHITPKPEARSQKVVIMVESPKFEVTGVSCLFFVCCRTEYEIVKRCCGGSKVLGLGSTIHHHRTKGGTCVHTL
jgi:hypothetical protein